MRVVADSHAIVWYGHDSPSLSGRARDTLDQAMESDGVVISIVTLVELWYVTQTTRGVSQEELDAISEQVSTSPTMGFSPIDEAVAGKFTTIDSRCAARSLGPIHRRHRARVRPPVGHRRPAHPELRTGRGHLVAEDQAARGNPGTWYTCGQKVRTKSEASLLTQSQGSTIPCVSLPRQR